MTREEAIAAIAQRLAIKLASEVTWEQIAQTIGALSAADKAEIVGLVRRRNAPGLGVELLGHLQAKAQALAAVEAASILADDAISLAELDRIL